MGMDICSGLYWAYSLILYIVWICYSEKLMEAATQTGLSNYRSLRVIINNNNNNCEKEIKRWYISRALPREKCVLRYKRCYLPNRYLRLEQIPLPQHSFLSLVFLYYKPSLLNLYIYIYLHIYIYIPMCVYTFVFWMSDRLMILIKAHCEFNKLLIDTYVRATA